MRARRRAGVRVGPPGRYARSVDDERTRGPTRWAIVPYELPPALRPWVRRCVGFAEHGGGPSVRRELPTPRAVVILEFGAPLVVSDLRRHIEPRTHRRGFVAGVDDGFTFTAHGGSQSGIELQLTHEGVAALFAVPADALAGRVVDLDDAWPSPLRDLSTVLAALPSWPERFAALSRALLAHGSTRAVGCRSEVAWASAQIVGSGGRCDIASIVRALGWSHRRTIAAFREHVGVPPKQLARIVRFDGVVRRLRATPAAEHRWAELAVDAGFADQAHFARECRRMSGLTPSGLRRLVASVPTDALAGGTLDPWG